jgi:hypothetical protein
MGGNCGWLENQPTDLAANFESNASKTLRVYPRVLKDIPRLAAITCERPPLTTRDERLSSFSSWFLLLEPGSYHGTSSL